MIFTNMVFNKNYIFSGYDENETGNPDAAKTAVGPALSSLMMNCSLLWFSLGAYFLWRSIGSLHIYIYRRLVLPLLVAFGSLKGVGAFGEPEGGRGGAEKAKQPQR